ncbi:SMP-30/gluconolactonase/LRE family protein [Fodinibius salsisoli]|uniref:SMP-30/gluconolactonase/LRE family protein n=1 Tax=Fodinibius salsisoli TaxID=2820877 RepID=A0ABT3PH37_9BACT|nr:SMP-30/gluconolactonase/LRE family protein [Fodinibius salsisoli]MCW9705235.1 SMP-30/gluconolactonase/LRE family protein [Fodinibius salsisoli]
MMRSLLLLLTLSLIMGCAQTSELLESEEQEKAPEPKMIGSIQQMEPELSELLDVNARPEVIGEGYEWSEGPVWVEEHQFLLFSDIPNNVIHKWKEGEGVTEYLKPAGYTGTEERGGELGSNGLIIGNDGSLLMAQHGDRRIVRMDAPLTDPKPNFVTLADRFNNKRINTPNDLVQHSNGSIYFTDPPYGFEQRGNDPAQELDFQGVYRLSPSGDIELVTDELYRPNGVALSPDEKTLYVGNSGREEPIWLAFDVAEDGSTSNGRVFLDPQKVVDQPGGPDGMDVDTEGNIYSTGPGGVWVISPEAKVLGIINIDRPTSNCTIGNDGKVLYITADDYLLRLSLK